MYHCKLPEASSDPARVVLLVCPCCLVSYPLFGLNSRFARIRRFRAVCTYLCWYSLNTLDIRSNTREYMSPYQPPWPSSAAPDELAAVYVLQIDFSKCEIITSKIFDTFYFIIISIGTMKTALKAGFLFMLISINELPTKMVRYDFKQRDYKNFSVTVRFSRLDQATKERNKLAKKREKRRSAELERIMISTELLCERHKTSTRTVLVKVTIGLLTTYLLRDKTSIVARGM